MENKESFKELITFILASVVLAISITWKNTALFWTALISVFLIIAINVLAKKWIAFHLETDVNHKFWQWYHFGFRNSEHFKRPLPMLWLPLVLSFVTKTIFWWLPVLEFDVSPRTERVSRRHGLYRFTEVTEWHIALIVAAGILANVFFAIVAYFFNFEFFAKLSIFYAFWSIIPLSNLDGSKMFFGSRVLWLTMTLFLIFILIWALVVI